MAKEAAELRLEQYAPTWFHSAAARIKATRKDPAPSHPRIKAVYEFYSKEKEEEVQSRSDQSLLAKIRSGHSILFAAYRKRIDESEDDTCPSCQLEPQTMEHWMTRCPGTLAQRRNIFGPDDYIRLGSLSKFPLKAIAFAKSSLLDVPATPVPL